jgi:hypothetical protein
VKRKRRRLSPLDEAAPAFVRGMLVTGMLMALQDRKAGKPDGHRVLRHAVQGGAALAAGTVAAEALMRRDYKLAAMAVAAGTAGVIAAEHLIDKNDKENGIGQEEK